MWDLSSLTRDWTHRFLTPGPPGKSHCSIICKGLEHPWILASAKSLKPVLHGHQGTTWLMDNSYICFYHAVRIDGFRLQVATSLLLLVSVKVSQPLQCCLDLYRMCSPPSGQSGTWVLIYLQFEILFRVRSMLVRATSMHVQFGDKPRSSKTSFLSSFLLSISIILFLSLSSHF